MLGQRQRPQRAAAAAVHLEESLNSHDVSWDQSSLNQPSTTSASISDSGSSADSSMDSDAELDRAEGLQGGGGGRVVRKWTEREHRKLSQLLDAWPSGTNIRWSEIAEQLPGRTGKQCRERFLNHVKPDLKKGGWEATEELQLIQWHSILGNHWSKISRKLTGRTENAVKNHWNAAWRSNKPRRPKGPLAVYVSQIKAHVQPQQALLNTLEAIKDTPELQAMLEVIRNNPNMRPPAAARAAAAAAAAAGRGGNGRLVEGHATVSPDAVHSHSSTSAAVVPHSGLPSPPGAAAAGGGRGMYPSPLPRYGSGPLPPGTPYGISPYSTPPGAAGRPIVGPVGGRPPPFVPRTGPMGLLDRYGGSDLHSPPSISTAGLPYDPQQMTAAGGRYAAAAYLYDQIRGAGNPAAGGGRAAGGWGPPADPFLDHPHPHHHQQQQYAGGYHPREPAPPATRHNWHPQQQEGGWYEEAPMPYHGPSGMGPPPDPMYDRSAAGFDQGWGPPGGRGGHPHAAAAGPAGGGSRGYETGGYDRMYPPSGSSRGPGYGPGPSGPAGSSMAPLGPSPTSAAAGGRPGSSAPPPHAAAAGGGGSSGRYMLTGDPTLDGSLPSSDALELQLIAAGAQELLEDLSPRHHQQHLQQQQGGSSLLGGRGPVDDPLLQPRDQGAGAGSGVQLLAPSSSRPGPPLDSPAAKRQRMGMDSSLMGAPSGLETGGGTMASPLTQQQQQQQGGVLSPHGPSHTTSVPTGGGSYQASPGPAASQQASQQQQQQQQQPWVVKQILQVLPGFPIDEIPGQQDSAQQQYSQQHPHPQQQQQQYSYPNQEDAGGWRDPGAGHMRPPSAGGGGSGGGGGACAGYSSGSQLRTASGRHEPDAVAAAAAAAAAADATQQQQWERVPAAGGYGSSMHHMQQQEVSYQHEHPHHHHHHPHQQQHLSGPPAGDPWGARGGDAYPQQQRWPAQHHQQQLAPHHYPPPAHHKQQPRLHPHYHHQQQQAAALPFEPVGGYVPGGHLTRSISSIDPRGGLPAAMASAYRAPGTVPRRLSRTGHGGSYSHWSTGRPGQPNVADLAWHSMRSNPPPSQGPWQQQQQQQGGGSTMEPAPQGQPSQQQQVLPPVVTLGPLSPPAAAEQQLPQPSTSQAGAATGGLGQLPSLQVPPLPEDLIDLPLVGALSRLHSAPVGWAGLGEEDTDSLNQFISDLQGM